MIKAVNLFCEAEVESRKIDYNDFGNINYNNFINKYVLK